MQFARLLKYSLISQFLSVRETSFFFFFFFWHGIFACIQTCLALPGANSFSWLLSYQAERFHSFRHLSSPVSCMYLRSCCTRDSSRPVGVLSPPPFFLTSRPMKIVLSSHQRVIKKNSRHSVSYNLKRLFPYFLFVYRCCILYTKRFRNSAQRGNYHWRWGMFYPIAVTTVRSQ